MVRRLSGSDDSYRGKPCAIRPHRSLVGAGLSAIAVHPLSNKSADMPPSLASRLLHWNGGAVAFCTLAQVSVVFSSPDVQASPVIPTQHPMAQPLLNPLYIFPVEEPLCAHSLSAVPSRPGGSAGRCCPAIL